VNVSSPSTSSPHAQRGTRLRLLAAAVFVSVVGLGPAIAWDLTTQPPRAEPRSAWPKASPWKVAGAQMKDSAKAMARVYLPARPEEPASPPAPATPAALTTAAPSRTSIPRPMALPAVIAVE
jgi:hypothetical protein